MFDSKTQTIAERKLLGRRKDNGKLMRGHAKLTRIGEQAPYFAIGTDNGCDHESVLAAFPDLKWLVDLHLCSENGQPMHSLANAIYLAEQGKLDSLAGHWHLTRAKAKEIASAVESAKRAIAFEVAALWATESEKLAQMKIVLADARDSSSYRYRAKAKAYNVAAKKLGTEKAFMLRESSKRLQEYVHHSFEVPLMVSWKISADRARAFLNAPGDHESLDYDVIDEGGPLIKIDGKAYDISCLYENDGYCTSEAADMELSIFANKRLAGEAARKYWEDMAKNDKSEFACMVGEETLISWALGEDAGPGTKKVNSLELWLDLSLDVPEEHFSRYDGTEMEVELNAKACDLLQVEHAWEDGPDSWFPCVAYR